MTITGFIATMAMQLMPAPGLPNWQIVGRNAQGEYAIDPRSVVRQGNRVRVFVRLRIRTPQGGTALGVMRYVYDCRANTIRSEASDIYEPRGRFIGTMQTRPEEVRDVRIPAASPNAQVLRHLCAPRRR